MDIDLSVMTTSSILPESGRNIDFHELYWAHLMSETRAVAVLLWLLELGRRGPRFNGGMNGLWWAVAIFLCLLLLSISLFAIKAIVWSTDQEKTPEALLITLALMSLVGAGTTVLAAARYKAFRLAKGALFATVGIVAALAVVMLVLFGVAKWLDPQIGWSGFSNLSWLRVPSDICSHAVRGAARHLGPDGQLGHEGLRLGLWPLIAVLRILSCPV